MTKLLILDFDGVVIDSNYQKELVINSFCVEKFKFNLKSKYSSFDLRLIDRYAQCELAKGGPITNSERLEIDLRILNAYQNFRIDPNIYLLSNLCRRKKIFFALVSASPSKSLKEIINKLSLGYLFDSVYGMEERNQKSIYYSLLLKKLSCSPKSAISIGDHFNDLIQSRLCGIPFYGIYNSSLLSYSPGTINFKSLKGVIKLITPSDTN